MATSRNDRTPVRAGACTYAIRCQGTLQRGPVCELDGGYGPPCRVSACLPSTVLWVCRFRLDIAEPPRFLGWPCYFTEVISSFLSDSALKIQASGPFKSALYWIPTANANRKFSILQLIHSTPSTKLKNSGLKWEGLDTQSCGIKRAQPNPNARLYVIHYSGTDGIP